MSTDTAKQGINHLQAHTRTRSVHDPEVQNILHSPTHRTPVEINQELLLYLIGRVNGLHARLDSLKLEIREQRR